MRDSPFKNNQGEKTFHVRKHLSVFDWPISETCREICKMREIRGGGEGANF